MHEFLHLVARLRCGDADPCRAFRHRLRVGLTVAAMIFLLSLLR